MIICLHTVIWFQLTNDYNNTPYLQINIFHANNSELYGIKYSYQMLIIYKSIYLDR